MGKANKEALVETVQALVELGIKKDGTDVRSTKKAAAAYTDAVFSAIAEILSQGDNVAVAGFGVFEVRKRAARKGRNPNTGKTIDIPESKTAALRVTGLKQAVRG